MHLSDRLMESCGAAQHRFTQEAPRGWTFGCPRRHPPTRDQRCTRRLWLAPQSLQASFWSPDFVYQATFVLVRIDSIYGQCRCLLKLTSACTTVWSKAHPLRRAVNCCTAVRNDFGLKRPGNQVTLGSDRLGSEYHSLRYCVRSLRSAIHAPSLRSDGYDTACQARGTLSSARAVMICSMSLEICSSPSRHRRSSDIEVRMVFKSRFRIVTSCCSRRTYGEISSDLIKALSGTMRVDGIFSKTSLIVLPARSCSSNEVSQGLLHNHR